MYGVFACAVAKTMFPKIPLIIAAGICFFVHLLYETKDYIGTYVMEKAPGRDENTWQNSLADQIVAMFAFLFAWYLGISSYEYTSFALLTSLAGIVFFKSINVVMD